CVQDSWMRAILLGFNLIWEPSDELHKQCSLSYEIRGLREKDMFTNEAVMLKAYAHFLPPEQTRFLILAVRMGLAAHAVFFVAESASNLKISGRPTKIMEHYDHLGEDVVFDLYCQVLARSKYGGAPIRPHNFDIGDSCAKADFLTAFFRNAFSIDDDVEPNFSDAIDLEGFMKRTASSRDGYFFTGWSKLKEVPLEKSDKEVKNGQPPPKDLEIQSTSRSSLRISSETTDEETARMAAKWRQLMRDACRVILTERNCSFIGQLASLIVSMWRAGGDHARPSLPYHNYNTVIDIEERSRVVTVWEERG
ncbi:hypothetical protein PFISCL1PPCAC_11415, partial [Pristionchus fissidentatus]